MSKKHLLNSFCLVLTGLFFGYSAAFVFDKPEAVFKNTAKMKNKRSTASINLDAATTESTVSAPIFKMSTQALMYDFVEVRIRPENIAATDNSVSTLKVVFTAKKDVPSHLEYKWNLSESQHTNDPISDTLPALKAGESKEVSFNLLGFSKEKQSHVSLVVNSQLEGHKANRTYSATSRPEDSFEFVIQQINQLEKEALAQAEKENSLAKGTVKSNNTAEQKTFLEKKFKRSEIIK